MRNLEAIASSLQGYDPQAMRVDQVLAFLSHLAQDTPALPTEWVPLPQALGRVLAQALASPIDVPGHDNSAMDGYACRGAELATGAQASLCVGVALAGAPYTGVVGPGECVRITTGAIMPPGLDTVVPSEFTQVNNDRVSWPAGVVRTGDNRRLAGEDLKRGSTALSEGHVLGPAELGLIASLGIAQVPVRQRLRVAYFSTGDEILSLGEPLREGAIYDSNRYTVMGLLQRLGCELIDLGVAPDDPVQLEACFRQAAEQAQVIITSGGVSVGEADHTKAMMRRLGDVAFWRIAMRPGRPMAVGRMGNTLLFGLPGNPVAVMVTFIAFVRPVLLQLMGAQGLAPTVIRAKSLEAMRKKAGRTEYQRGVLVRQDAEQVWVKTTGNQGSGVLSSMVQADGLIVLHHEQGHVAVGDEVDVLLLNSCY